LNEGGSGWHSADLRVSAHAVGVATPAAAARDTGLREGLFVLEPSEKGNLMSTCRRLLLLCAALVLGAATAGAVDFVAFESGPVRPIALSANGTKLFVVNTPDNRLEIFDVGAAGIAKSASVPVGLEPVSVAIRNASEVWVVNHLSDSVSIVDVASSPPRVTRTLLVGDEPRDILFAGTGGNRAFITTARRGQHRTDASIAGVPGAGDPLLTTSGVGRADVWVFDATNLGATLGGTPIRILSLFGDTPRALAKSTNGDTVYVAVFASGNQTTTVSEGMVCNGFALNAPCTNSQNLDTPGGNPGPSTDHNGTNAPEVGLIVKFNPATGKWEDERARDWSEAVRFNLPDRDVFAVDANTLTQTNQWSSVGTTLFNMAVNPVSGKIYVTNTESRNEVRFEGPGVFAAAFKPSGEPATVQGHLAEARITVLDGANVLPRHLNKHIDYSQLPAPSGTKAKSLATPLDVVVSPDGSKLYVAAFGSGKVGVFDTATLENDSFDPAITSANYLPVTGGGPGGLALDTARDRLYVLTRFDNGVSAIDLTTGSEIVHRTLHNPEPAAVTEGRFMLYDANATSSNGEASCSSCHTFGDMDQLAWDLGNPDDDEASNPITINLGVAAGTFSPPINGTGVTAQFSALKGPMTTQTLRGLSNSGAMHWRGDRSNGCLGQSATDEDLSFRNFIVAFPGLVGLDVSFTCPNPPPSLAADMQKFSDFMLEVQLPPNPVRSLENSLTPAQANGRNFYLGNSFTSGGSNPSQTGVGGSTIAGRRADGANLDGFGFTCNGCHTLDPAQGFFGTGKLASFENEAQIMKIAHLRNMYQKVGMFGMPDVPFNNALNTPHEGDEVRGFGFLHDGSTDTTFRFFQATVFNQANLFSLGVTGFTTGNAGNGVRRDMEQFMLAFDTDLAPIVGQQVTRTSSNGAAVDPRIDLIDQRASTAFTSKVLGGAVTEADVVVKAAVGGRVKGWVKDAATGANYEPDDGGASVTLASLKALVGTPGQEVTFTAVPPGSGRRAGINRDRDSWNDGVDNCPDTSQLSQADADTDLVGDACDNCAAKSNASQADTDADGTGNLCDNQCPGLATTTLASVFPASGPIGQVVEVTGTGFGTNVQASFGGVPAAVTFSLGRYLVTVPAGLANGPHVVTLSNPEGCQSQEVVNFTVTAPTSCGLIGIEPFAMLALLAGVRRLRAAPTR
jgi:DNA-binding beta-propeller fold protein YncE/mono/diheme cytochrome c family protein